jgi:hypothetical protein
MQDEWKEEVPLLFQVQNQHNMAVKGWKWCSTAVLLGGNKFAWADSQRNDAFISTLMELEEAFMDKVKRGIRPQPDGSESARKALGRIHPKDNGLSTVLPTEAYLWSKKLREAKAAEKAAKAQIDLYAQYIQSAIGDATLGHFPEIGAETLSLLPTEIAEAIVDHPIEILGHSWKHQDRAGFVVQPTSFRVLREEKQGKKKR